MDKKESGLGVTDFEFAGSEFVWGENSDGCYCNYVVPLPINYPRRVPVLPNCLLQACSWPRLGKKHGNGRFALSSNFYNAFVGFFPVNGGFNVNLIYK
jgi:hypothetical protein